MQTVNYAFAEGQEVRLKVDPEKTRLIVVAMHTQNGGSSYTVSNGISYTGIHCAYELESVESSGAGTKKAGFGAKQ